MKVKRDLFDVVLLFLAVWVMVLGQGTLAMGDGIEGCSDSEVHTATAENIINNRTKIDHPLTNGNPDAFVFVTQNWNPGGKNGKYNDAAIGVYYNGSHWTVFNQYENPDPAIPMPVGASFNFKVVGPSESVFIHTATSGNIGDHWLTDNETEIDHPFTNGHPNALLFVTQNWNPRSGVGKYNDAAIGVKYKDNKWMIFNQDGGSMPVGADFNVKVVLPCESAFVHTATGGNIELHRTIIDHPMTNGNSGAVMLVTQNCNPGGGVGQYNDHSIGVWYNGSQWEVFNQDHAGMVAGLDFNVMVLEASDFFLHTATRDNVAYIGSLRTIIDHPMANSAPNALLFVTQNWNPDGLYPGTYNNSPIGVMYVSPRWEIYNQFPPNVDMPLGASFNVKVAPLSESTFFHRATALNSVDSVTMINHPLTNNNPDVLLFVIQNWNPGGGTGWPFNNAPIGVWYDGNYWTIFNEDQSDVREGSWFNVKVVLPSESAFVHTATVGNITSFGHTTNIDHPMTNGNPNARLLVTPSWNPEGAGGARNNAPIGVWYNSSSSKWAIFNQYDPSGGVGLITKMTPGASFNVMVLSECDLSCVPCVCQDADYNGDGIVNFMDYVVLAKSWLEYDLSVNLAFSSAIVDAADMEEFSRHWLEICE